MTATSWKDSKGKTKQGKLVWIASDEDITPEFDTEKHKLVSKPKPEKGSVSNKGVVTAKKSGTLYVYCCDTGSFDYEKFIVEVLASPSKLFLGSKDGITESKEALKKFALNAGETAKIYICPFVKDGTADTTNTYSVSVGKNDQAKYVSLSSVKKSGSILYFNITGVTFDESKKKPASVKLVTECIQSGKKTSATAVICNSVQGLSVSDLSAEEPLLAKKKNSFSMKLVPTTHIEGVATTTDKLKVYVGLSSVTLDDEGKKATADKGATIKAKFDAKTMKLTLTASKDAEETAVVVLAATNTVTKKTVLYPILKVDASGKVSWQAKVISDNTSAGSGSGSGAGGVSVFFLTGADLMPKNLSAENLPLGFDGVVNLRLTFSSRVRASRFSMSLTSPCSIFHSFSCLSITE